VNIISYNFLLSLYLWKCKVNLWNWIYIWFLIPLLFVISACCLQTLSTRPISFIKRTFYPMDSKWHYSQTEYDTNILYKLPSEPQLFVNTVTTCMWELGGRKNLLTEICHFNTQKYKKSFSQERSSRLWYIGYNQVIINVFTKECDFEIANLYYKKIRNTVVTKCCMFIKYIFCMKFDLIWFELNSFDHAFAWPHKLLSVNFNCA